FDNPRAGAPRGHGGVPGCRVDHRLGQQFAGRSGAAIAEPRRMNPLISQLPPVRGRLTADAAIGKQTWFGVGGPAEVLFRPADLADLAEFLAALPPRIPVTVIEVGSNLLVRDGGIPGVVIRLGRGFAAIE